MRKARRGRADGFSGGDEARGQVGTGRARGDRAEPDALDTGERHGAQAERGEDAAGALHVACGAGGDRYVHRAVGNDRVGWGGGDD